jgi:hypothetical protein
VVEYSLQRQDQGVELVVYLACALRCKWRCDTSGRVSSTHLRVFFLLVLIFILVCLVLIFFAP